MRDNKGNGVTLTGIRFDQKPVLCGRLGKGELQVELKRIWQILVQSNGLQLVCRIIVDSGENLVLEADAAASISGESAFWPYQVNIKDIERVAFNAE